VCTRLCKLAIKVKGLKGLSVSKMYPSLPVSTKSNKVRMWASISTSGYYIPQNSDPADKVSRAVNLMEESPCLCHHIHWIWTLTQAIGINPLSFQCGHDQSSKITRPKRRTNWRCQLVKKKRCFPFVNNIVMLILHSISACQIFSIMTLLLALIFKGTDVYACRIHLAARVWQTLTIIFAAGLFSQNLVNAWSWFKASAEQWITYFLNTSGLGLLV